MFVNLSRRSQSLVERQIRLIDDLEQGEQDEERLGSLFRMDHLATRMRRNSENLLVLAGHDSSRRWNQPVALVDVLRAAVSEIEQYERVSLNVQPGISVRGHAVNDTVHLLAELAENATSFSSAETPVTVSGHLLSSGGVLLDITDQGVGMGAEEMAHANWRLDNPPVVDVAVSRRMGLFVVARLAARHGIRVRLRPAASGGLTALVWLPDEVISRDGSSSAAPMTDGCRRSHGRPEPAQPGQPSAPPASRSTSARPPPRRSAPRGHPSSPRCMATCTRTATWAPGACPVSARTPELPTPRRPSLAHCPPSAPAPSLPTSRMTSRSPPRRSGPSIRPPDPCPPSTTTRSPAGADPPGAEQAGPAAATPAGPSALSTGNGQQLPKRVVEQPRLRRRCCCPRQHRHVQPACRRRQRPVPPALARRARRSGRAARPARRLGVRDVQRAGHH